MTRNENFTPQFQSKFRDSRLVIGNEDVNQDSRIKLTFFVGVYNSLEYLSELYESINCQKNENFKILLVDNNSTDGTWEEVLEWQTELPQRIQLVRNPINVGGTATLQLNLDLISTEWFASFHQDDIYLPNHAETLIEAIEICNSKDIMISTEMLSIDESGAELPMKPRSSWLISDMTKEEQFVANVFVHSVYWPCTAFRTKQFKEITVPWHSAAFPDTEILLRLLCLGKSLQISVPSVYYRENPKSMSHYLGIEEKLFVAADGLLRVFNSSQFAALIEEQDEMALDVFVESLIKGINVRLENSSILSTLVCLHVLETINAKNDYQNIKLLFRLTELYKKLSGERTIEVLENVARFQQEKTSTLSFDNPQVREFKSRKKSVSTTNDNLRKLSNRNNLAKLRIFRIRKYLLYRLIKIKILVQKKHPWRF